jgi:hypothetical protein
MSAFSELEMTVEEEVVTFFKVMSKNVLEGTNRNHANTRKLDLSICQIYVKYLWSNLFGLHFTAAFLDGRKQIIIAMITCPSHKTVFTALTHKTV